MPDKLTNLIRITKKLTKTQLWNNIAAVFELQFVKEWVGKTITKRLYDFGTDAYGDDLVTDRAAQGFVYSVFTIMQKADKGQKTDNVTLNDTGTFYNSFEIDINENLILIKADFIKSEGHIGENFLYSYDSLQSFEQAIAALSETEFETLLQIVTPYIIKNVRNELNL